MKKTFAVLVLFVSVSQFADAATRGYLKEVGRRGDIYFDGFNDAGEQGDGFQINFALQMGSITQEQVDLMWACMKKKDTHAISISTASTSSQEVPTDIPGRTTRFHTSTYDVECVKAPGFLNFWRKKMGGQ